MTTSDNRFAQHLVLSVGLFMHVVYIGCYSWSLLSELCIFTTRGAVPSVSVCCVCAVSILTVGLHAIASDNESSVNNRPINNSLLTANRMGCVCLQPIRVQELLWLYLHPQLIIDRISVMWEIYIFSSFTYSLPHTYLHYLSRQKNCTF